MPEKEPIYQDLWRDLSKSIIVTLQPHLDSLNSSKRQPPREIIFGDQTITVKKGGFPKTVTIIHQTPTHILSFKVSNRKNEKRLININKINKITNQHNYITDKTQALDALHNLNLLLNNQ